MALIGWPSSWTCALSSTVRRFRFNGRHCSEWTNTNLWQLLRSSIKLPPANKLTLICDYDISRTRKSWQYEFAPLGAFLSLQLHSTGLPAFKTNLNAGLVISKQSTSNNKKGRGARAFELGGSFESFAFTRWVLSLSLSLAFDLLLISDVIPPLLVDFCAVGSEDYWSRVIFTLCEWWIQAGIPVNLFLNVPYPEM